MICNYSHIGKYLLSLLILITIKYSPLNAQMKILPLGNSITQGNSAQGSYREALWEIFQTNLVNIDYVGSLNQPNDCGAWPNANPAFVDQDHEGHWGWKVDEILNGTGPGGPWNCRIDVLGNDISDWLTGIVPDIALVHLGTNDMFASEPVLGTIGEISLVIDALRVANPAIQIYLAQLIPTTDNGRNMRINALNLEIPNLVISKNTVASPIFLVDQNTGFNANTDTYDGTHPNDQGEQKMAQAWYNAITTTLPVGITQLEARLEKDMINLNWETAWELNNKGFEIEHWEDKLSQYVNMGFVAGNGTLDSRSLYTYSAGAFAAGSHVFRLKQIDFDGKFSFSRAIRVEVESSLDQKGQIYPIPTQEYLHYNLPNSKNQTFSFTIFDTQGKQVLGDRKNTSAGKINVSNLSPGMYFIDIKRSSGKREQHKFIIN